MRNNRFGNRISGGNSVVECLLAKEDVASSSLVSRSIKSRQVSYLSALYSWDDSGENRFLRYLCILMSLLSLMFFRLCESGSPKQSSLCRFKKVGSYLTETIPKVTFLALIYSIFALFLHKFALKCRVDFSQPFQIFGRLKSTLHTVFKSFYIVIVFFERRP